MRPSMILRPSVEVTVLRDGKMLAIRTTKYGGGFYGVGGKVEEGETFEQAARRELLEETGCEALEIHFVAGHTLDPLPLDPEKGLWYCAGFVADIGDQEPRKCEPHTEPFWTSVENMEHNSLFPQWYAWWIALLDNLAGAERARRGREAWDTVDDEGAREFVLGHMDWCAEEAQERANRETDRRAKWTGFAVTSLWKAARAYLGGGRLGGKE